ARTPSHAISRTRASSLGRRTAPKRPPASASWSTNQQRIGQFARCARAPSASTLAHGSQLITRRGLMGWLVSALAGYVLGHALDVVVPATGQWLFSGPTQGVGPCTY